MLTLRIVLSTTRSGAPVALSAVAVVSLATFDAGPEPAELMADTL